MSVGHFAGGIAIGVALVWVTALVTTSFVGTRTPSEFPYCYQFDPKSDITPFVLATVVAIRGRDTDSQGHIIGWSKSPDQFMPDWQAYSEQWRRC